MIENYESIIYEDKDVKTNVNVKFTNEAIFFDLDGTLWEVIDSTYNSVNKITKKYNLPSVTINTICNVFGKNRIESAKLYFPNLREEDALKLLDEIAILNIQNLKENGGNVYKNVKETIKRLKKDYDLYIVSNTAHKEYIESFLISSDLKEYFKDYIAASELNISKADAINKLTKQYNIEKSVYGGDTKKDLESAQEAQIPFIYAKYGFGKDLKVQYYINDISELENILKKIFNFESGDINE